MNIFLLCAQFHLGGDIHQLIYSEHIFRLFLSTLTRAVSRQQKMTNDEKNQRRRLMRIQKRNRARAGMPVNPIVDALDPPSSSSARAVQQTQATIITQETKDLRDYFEDASDDESPPAKAAKRK